MTLQAKNTRRLRPGHLIIFIVFIIIRNSFATESEQSSHGTADHTKFDSHNGHSGEDKNDGDHEGGHFSHAHFSVFHVNFEHVEVPFIIGLWIFVSALAKVGEFNKRIVSGLIIISVSYLCLHIIGYSKYY